MVLRKLVLYKKIKRNWDYKEHHSQKLTQCGSKTEIRPESIKYIEASKNDTSEKKNGP